MRKITVDSVHQFITGVQTWKKQNMEIHHIDNKSLMYLHSNLIAKLEKGYLTIYDGGWRTNTTEERLNGVLHLMETKVYVFQKHGDWFIRDYDNDTTIPFINGYRIKV